MEQKELEYYLSQVRRIAEHREKGAMLKIRKTFKALLRDLKHFVADEYADLAENDELTFEILNRKRQYARFIEETVKIIDSYYPDALKQTTDVVEQTYQLVYDGMIDSVEKCSTSAELDEVFKGIKAATPQQIRAAVMNPITKITVPDTYAKDRANYIYDLKRELNTGLLNGDRYSTMAKRIVDRTKIAYRRAECIVRTETHRVREQGFCDSAVEINQTLEQGETSMRMVKTWCTMEDERVRGGKKGQKANHRKMNGVSVPIDEKFDLGRGIKTMCPGSSGDAANDINCRCFLVHELKDMNANGNKSFISQLSNRKLSPYIDEYNDYDKYREAVSDFEGDRTDYLDDIFKSKVKTSWEKVDENWNPTDFVKVKKIESTIAELQKKYPMQGVKELEYSVTPKSIVVCDYLDLEYYLPNGKNDRRLNDEAAAQVFMLNDRTVLIGFRRNQLFESLDDALKERASSIKSGKILSTVGGSSPETIAIHEWGHVMQAHINTALIYEDETANELFNWYKSMSKEEISIGLSNYGAENFGEFQAECFLELQMVNPRPIAIKYGEYLKKIMEKGY